MFARGPVGRAVGTFILWLSVKPTASNMIYIATWIGKHHLSPRGVKLCILFPILATALLLF